MYIIWHDNDYDLALWVYKNSCLKDKQDVVLRQIPKTNDEKLLTADFKDRTDYFILPFIKFATPDILIQKINKDGTSKILVATELMTHTPHHDHIFQRFERIFCISKEKIPVALILPDMKTKIEKGTKTGYRPVSYKPSQLVVHLYLKTTQINSNPTLMFFWPQKNGYLKYDEKHQTAPKIEGQILSWLDFINECIEKDGLVDIGASKVMRDQISFLEDKYPFQDGKFDSSLAFIVFIKEFPKVYKSLIRAKIVNTKLFIEKSQLNKKELPEGFLGRESTVLFEYKSKTFRTDPYAGFLCGVFNMFCMDNKGEKMHNLVHIPHGIKYSLVSHSTKKRPTFSEMSEDFNQCPMHSSPNLEKLGLENLIKHVHSKCTYTFSKQQRIFGTLPDIIIFDDKILYNQNHGY
jgi:hypothetical protein